MFLEIFWWEKKALEVAGTYFNKRRKLGILDKDLGSSDVISVFRTEHVTRFTVRVLPTCGRIISIEYGWKRLVF